MIASMKQYSWGGLWNILKQAGPLFKLGARQGTSAHAQPMLAAKDSYIS